MCAICNTETLLNVPKQKAWSEYFFFLLFALVPNIDNIQNLGLMKGTYETHACKET